MQHDNEFLEYVRELLEPFGNITFRAMFGGYGIYNNKIIFAIIVDNELYFKADAEVGEIFQKQGSEQFSYEGRGKVIKMSYWRVPAEVLDDHELLKQWWELAYGVALRSGKKTKG